MLEISSELQRIALTHCTEEMHRFSIQKYICRDILIHNKVPDGSSLNSTVQQCCNIFIKYIETKFACA